MRDFYPSCTYSIDNFQTNGDSGVKINLETLDKKNNKKSTILNVPEIQAGLELALGNKNASLKHGTISIYR